ncbi:hypothetical protein BD770DRAFT_408148 [Pilaira anomala]|nr:hypothetical protein BD770DRAFT_408148 [Pilaira anomala]
MKSMEPSISLSSLEPHTSLSSTLELLSNISNSHHTQLDQRDLAPSTAIHDINTTGSNSTIHDSFTCIRQQPFTEEHTMEPTGLGDNESLTSDQLNHKVCFLLAISGFLRPSDLHRINLDKILWTLHSLTVYRLSQRKTNRHPDVSLCPILAYQFYRSRIVTTRSLGPHPVGPSRTIIFLIRNLNDFSLAVTSQTIGRHIRSLLSLILEDDNSSGGPLRAHAIGSTNAAINDTNLDDILVPRLMDFVSL